LGAACLPGITPKRHLYDTGTVRHTGYDVQ
jgi:hypothetical protein